MKTLALPVLCITLCGAGACSVFVQADRSKIEDDMYTPTDAGAVDAAAEAGAEEDAGDDDAG
jgi:hypothetical protein